MSVLLYGCTIKKLDKNALRSYEQILGAAPIKTPVVRPHTSHLINHLSKTNKTCWAWLEKQERTHSDVLLWTATHGYSGVGRQTKTYIHQPSVDTGGSLGDLANRDVRPKKVREIHAVNTL